MSRETILNLLAVASVAIMVAAAVALSDLGNIVVMS